MRRHKTCLDECFDNRFEHENMFEQYPSYVPTKKKPFLKDSLLHHSYQSSLDSIQLYKAFFVRKGECIRTRWNLVRSFVSEIKKFRKLKSILAS
jgi:hypothetical protein